MSTLGFQPDGVDGNKLSQADCDRLHRLKNRPDQPTVNGIPLSFPKYAYSPYPRAIYHATDPTSPRLVQDADEERNFLSRGWADSPVTAEAAAERHHDQTVAIPAAERAYADRRMSAAAQAEVAALEATADDHIVDVPAPVRRRGRPRKSPDA